MKRRWRGKGERCAGVEEEEEEVETEGREVVQ